MECPYCGGEMKKGAIPASRDGRVRWVECEDCDPFSAAGRETVWLSGPSLLMATHAEAWHCPDCRVVIAPVKAFEEPGERLRRKWGELVSRADALRRESEARRAERQREKRGETRRKKDPWEVE